MSVKLNLEALIGDHILTGVDFSTSTIENFDYGDASVMNFVLDGVIYTAVEDPEDGYRSSLGSLLVGAASEVGNMFLACHVTCKMRDGNDSDVLQMTDKKTGQVVLEVGTDHSDDYYPSFVSHFSPERMAPNWHQFQMWGATS